MSPVVEFVDVHAAYGPFRALFGVSLTVPAGGAVALVGPNGAGKTTVARVGTGLLRPSAGRVLVDGQDLTGQAAFRFARAGVAHAPEGRSVFATLTVSENLELALRGRNGRSRLRQGLAAAFELFPRLGERRHQAAGTLSGGEQRMLALARVLVDPPKVLFADELSLGLAPMVVSQVYEFLARVRDSGTSLLVIEQHVSHALALCDRVAVLEHGSLKWVGPTNEAGSMVQAFLHVGTAPPPSPTAR